MFKKILEVIAIIFRTFFTRPTFDNEKPPMGDKVEVEVETKEVVKNKDSPLSPKEEPPLVVPSEPVEEQTPPTPTNPPIEKETPVDNVVDDKHFDRTYTRNEVRRIQRALNELTTMITRTPLVADGIFGAKSVELLKNFQRLNNYPVSNTLVGKARDHIESYIDKKFITEADKVKRAHMIDMAPAMLFAIMEVESRDAGFFSDGSCVILFERHIFFRQYRDKYGRGAALKLEKEYPNLINQSAGGYSGGMSEWKRFEAAAKLDRECAILSTSWGLGQVMGFNWQLVKANSVEDLFERSTSNEWEQMVFMTNFLVHANNGEIIKAAKRLDFATIARVYNGAAYAKNQYDVKIRNAYNKYIKTYPH